MLQILQETFNYILLLTRDLLNTTFCQHTAKYLQKSASFNTTVNGFFFFLDYATFHKHLQI